MVIQQHESKHVHLWESTRTMFSGWPYPRLFLEYCRCGAFRKENGEVLEPMKGEPANGNG